MYHDSSMCDRTDLYVWHDSFTNKRRMYADNTSDLNSVLKSSGAYTRGKHLRTRTRVMKHMLILHCICSHTHESWITWSYYICFNVWFLVFDVLQYHIWIRFWRARERISASAHTHMSHESWIQCHYLVDGIFRLVFAAQARPALLLEGSVSSVEPGDSRLVQATTRVVCAV